MASLFSKIQVISLYRRLLRLHQKLPNKLSALGTVYIRSEFKRHRDVNDREIMRKFIKEWEVYISHINLRMHFGVVGFCEYTRGPIDVK